MRLTSYEMREFREDAAFLLLVQDRLKYKGRWLSHEEVWDGPTGSGQGRVIASPTIKQPICGET